MDLKFFSYKLPRLKVVQEAFGNCKTCKEYVPLVCDPNDKTEKKWCCPKCDEVVIIRGDLL
jgi:predicted RNA-binding Zn-ribbon protein involved in translation (DUF1610 family)